MKGLWCSFFKSLDAMEDELRCLCRKKKKAETTCGCDKKESCFNPKDICSIGEQRCHGVQKEEKC